VWPCGNTDDLNKEWLHLSIETTPAKTTDKYFYDSISPDNFLENEHCAEIVARYDAIDHPNHPNDQSWNYKFYKNDLDCNVKKFFICQQNVACYKTDKFRCTKRKSPLL